MLLKVGSEKWLMALASLEEEIKLRRKNNLSLQMYSQFSIIFYISHRSAS